MKNKVLWLLFVLVLFISSCITQQKKENFAYGYFRENPAKLAEICADQFPPRDSIAPGKETLRTDTVMLPGLEVPCPPVPGQKTVYVKCPPAKTITNTVHKTDTIFRENTARVKELSLKLQAETVKRNVAEDDLKELEEQVKSARKYKWASGILALMIAAFTIKRFLP